MVNLASENNALKDKITQMKEIIKANQTNNNINSSLSTNQYITKLKESKSKIVYLKEKNEKYFIEINHLNDIINKSKEKYNKILNDLEEKSNQLKKLFEEKDKRSNYISILQTENESYKSYIVKIENENTRLSDLIGKKEKALHVNYSDYHLINI